MTIAPVEIRRSSPREAERLTAIAHAAKRHWGYAEDLIQLWADDLTVTPAFVDAHPVYCAATRSDILGFYALSREGRAFELRHLWVQPRDMRAGIGTALFRHAIATARAMGAASLEIESDPNAAGFYERMGARRVGTVPSKPAGRELPVLMMTLGADSAE